MCGIAGIGRSESRLPSSSEDLVRRMASTMRHRGPDAMRVHATRDAVLAATRLSIIDLRREADQPITNEDGTVTIAFNGEIYNHVELRERLERRGHKFRTNTDTEVLVHLYEDEDIGMVNHLRGMFAFSIWDAPRGRLLLARDHFGIKPLYHAEFDGSVIWASEIRALREAGLGSTLDRDAIAAFLGLGHVPVPRTIFTGIRALPPGTLRVVDSRGQTDHAFWQPSPEVAMHMRWHEAVKRVRVALDEAVRAHLVADVPLGLFLSGGVDSAAVAASLARIGRTDVRAFSIGFAEAEYDESEPAEAIAHGLGLDISVRRVGGDDVARAMPGILRAMDQPTSDGVNTYFVSRAVSEAGLRVALSGLGGDELFDGYPHMRILPRVSHVVRLAHGVGAASRIAAALGQRRHGTWSSRLQKLLAAPTADEASLYLASRRVLDDATISGAIATRLPADSVNAPPRQIRGAAAFTFLELRNYTVNQLLRDTDVMTMANSVEGRIPFLDVPFFTTINRIPRRYFSREAPKGLLRRTLGPTIEKCVPRAKRGFTFPIARWLDGPLATTLAEGLDAAVDFQFLTRRARDRLEADFQSRRRPWAHLWAPSILGSWARAIDKRENVEVVLA